MRAGPFVTNRQPGVNEAIRLRVVYMLLQLSLNLGTANAIGVLHD
jgi:hypothetical protein